MVIKTEGEGLANLPPERGRDGAHSKPSPLQGHSCPCPYNHNSVVKVTWGRSILATFHEFDLGAWVQRNYDNSGLQVV